MRRSPWVISFTTFKMAAWQPYWIVWCLDSKFSLALNIISSPNFSVTVLVSVGRFLVISNSVQLQSTLTTKLGGILDSSVHLSVFLPVTPCFHLVTSAVLDRFSSYLAEIVISMRGLVHDISSSDFRHQWSLACGNVSHVMTLNLTYIFKVTWLCFYIRNYWNVFSRGLWTVAPT